MEGPELALKGCLFEATSLANGGLATHFSIWVFGESDGTMFPKVSEFLTVSCRPTLCSVTTI
jgi:hypothetical protein